MRRHYSLIALGAAAAAIALAWAPADKRIHRWFPGLGHANLPADETLPELADLPVVAVAPKGAPRAIAVLVTGSGGWAEIDRRMARALAEDGVATIGLDSLRYFLSARSPDEVGADVGRVIASARRVWGEKDVALVGYSFGADTIAVAYNHLPEVDRLDVRTVAMLGVSRTADLGMGVAKYAARFEGFARPTRPQVAAIEQAAEAPRILCVYGQEEQAVGRTICPSLDPTRVDVVETPGGHHFDHDFGRLGHLIAATLAVPAHG